MHNFFKILAISIVILNLEIQASFASPESRPSREHLVYWADTPQALDVYRIYGRQDGPTVMILGGIQGDEPGGFLSADSYTDLALKRGNLIIVPRANFKSITQFHRGPDGDMNRKFKEGLKDDPDLKIIDTLKSLIAESDLLLNLHDGSGFYRPKWESTMFGPHRYGQCLIADTDLYHHKATGRNIPLAMYAQKVIEAVNKEIDEPRHHFHFFNTKTSDNDSPYQEQRGSATYYALTQVGIPAFGVETSKQLPTLDMKVYQHNLAVNAFLELFGVEIAPPSFKLAKPALGYVLLAVNDAWPMVVAGGQTLKVASGDLVKVLHVEANYDRGISVDFLGLGGYNDLGQALTITKPTSVVVKKDHTKIGLVNIELLPSGSSSGSPQLLGSGQIILPNQAQVAEPAPPTEIAATVPQVKDETSEPVHTITGELAPPVATSQAAKVAKAAQMPKEIERSATELKTPPAPTPTTKKPTNKVTGFLVELDGQALTILPGAELEVLAGSKLKLIGLASDGTLSPRIDMNLKGFLPKAKRQNNDGDDRGFTADTATDMMPSFSENRKGVLYKINAELSRNILASCTIKIIKPRLAGLTFQYQGKSYSVKVGQRHSIKTGAPLTITAVELIGGRKLTSPRFTLGGDPFPSKLPQTITMPGFNANLAIFNGEALAGKVTFVAR